MSGFGNFINTNSGAVGGVFSSLISSIASSITANRQNRKNRKFQAEQAQLARDWQEDMYNKYSSPSAMVQQYQDAGLNPSLAYGGQTGQTFSANSGQTSGSQMMPDFSGLDVSQFISALAGLKIEGKKANAQVTAAEAAAKRDNAEANYFNKQAAAIDIENQFKPQLLKQNLDKGELELQNLQKGLTLLDERIKTEQSQQNLNKDALLNNAVNRLVARRTAGKILAETNTEQERLATEILKQQNIEADTEHKAQQIVRMEFQNYIDCALLVLKQKETDANVRKLNADALEQEIDNYYYQSYGYKPSTGLYGYLMQILMNIPESGYRLVQEIGKAGEVIRQQPNIGSARIINNE